MFLLILQCLLYTVLFIKTLDQTVNIQFLLSFKVSQCKSEATSVCSGQYICHTVLFANFFLKLHCLVLRMKVHPSLDQVFCEVTHANTAAAAKSLQSCPTLCDPRDSSPPGSPSLGFSRQEHWSGLPLPSPTLTLLGGNKSQDSLGWHSKPINREFYIASDLLHAVLGIVMGSNTA